MRRKATKNLVFIFDKAQYVAWRQTSHAATVVTGDIFVAHDLEQRNEPFIEFWSYLTGSEIHDAFELTKSVATSWWKPFLSEVYFGEIQLADAYQKDMWYAITTSILTHKIVDRILVEKNPSKVFIFHNFESPLVWDSTAIPSSDVSNAVAVWTATQKGILVQRLFETREITPLPSRRRTSSTFSPRPVRVKNLSAKVILNCAPDWALRKRVGHFAHALENHPEYRHHVLAFSEDKVYDNFAEIVDYRAFLDAADTSNKLEHQLEQAWAAFWSRKESQLPYIFNNANLKFQFHEFWRTVKEGAREASAFATVLREQRPSLCLFEIDRDGTTTCRQRVAKALGVTTATLFHGGTGSNHAQYSDGWSEADVLFVPGQWDKQGFINAGREPKSIIPIGPMFASIPRTSKGDRILVVTASDYGLAYPYINKIKLRQEWRAFVSFMERRSDLEFVLRCHPHYDFHDFYETLSLPKNARWNSVGPIDDILKTTGKVIVFNSPTTAGLNSMLQNIPTVYYCTCIYEAPSLKSAYDVPCMSRAANLKELEAFIDSKSSEGQKEFLNGFFQGENSSHALSLFLNEVAKLTGAEGGTARHLSTHKKRVLFVSHSSGWNGAENVLFSLMSRLNRDKFELVVVLPEANGELSARVLEKELCGRVISLKPWISKSSAARSFLNYQSSLEQRVKQIELLIDQEHIDIVFTNSSVITEGALAAKRKKVSHVWYVHELLADNPELHLLHSPAAVFSVMNALSDKVIVVSEAIRDSLIHIVEPGKIEVVINAVDSPIVRKADPTSRPTVCFLGSLSQRKGALKLPSIAKEVQKQIPDVLFKVIGHDGGVLSDLRAAIRNEGMENHFDVMGFRGDALDELANTDALILPSINDPMPLVILEAMMLGKPVVANGATGAREMVVDGETGYLVDDDYAEPLSRLLADKSLNEKFGKAAKQRASEVFNSEDYTRKMESILDDVLRANAQFEN